MQPFRLIVFKTYKWELFLSWLIPYYCPFLSKRRRVKIKWYFKYAGGRRAHAYLCKSLMSLKPKPIDFSKIEFPDFEWTIETKRDEERIKD